MQEEILIKRYRSGTTIHYFNTDINPNNFPTSTMPAVIKLTSADDIPMELHAFDGVFLTGNSSTVLWKRNIQPNLYDPEVKMNYVYDSLGASGNYAAAPTSVLPNPNYVSGRTFSTFLETPIGQLHTELIRSSFEDSMNLQFTAGTKSFVFFESTLYDDLYANIKLEKTFDILNTLNIYNKVTGEIPIRESKTGVVFGKLEAIQKISDSNGNKIRIPLRNVPIGIFNQSVEFQNPNEQDSEGNRIRLNYRPLTITEDAYPTDPECLSWYFNSESAVFDNAFLKPSPLDGANPHPTFSGVVFTNENGEFFLHNVEIGPQILFFEVDLLKQGLTKDEVALNFFPYPPNYDNISIDTIPHYFYRALPIDVVPSWGTSYQTGYTEVDISVNLDLRKWATYIIPPVTYNNFQMDSAEYRQRFKAPLTVKVRDMSKFNKKKLKSLTQAEKLEAYPSTGIQMVEIQNIIDKNSNQQWEWANEFSQIKDKALFYSYGYHAVKLPANIYDDQQYKTNIDGIPKTSTIEEAKFSKGVWLCGYQLKVFLTDEERYYRTTGMEVGWNDSTALKWYSRDHYHCNLYDTSGKTNPSIYQFSNANNEYGVTLGEGMGMFPYEQAWTKNYPKPYSIPKKPTVANFLDPYATRQYMETPTWKDGDIIPGYSYVGFAGFGFGWNSNTPQYTDFATDVAGGSEKTDMYRYEPTVNGDCGCYSNGYCYELDAANGGVGVGKTSRVVNAEEFQRVEAGYGYFLFPTSMPRIIAYPWHYDGFHRKETDYEYVKLNGLQDSAYTSQSDLMIPGAFSNVYLHHYHSYSLINNGKSIAMNLSLKGTGGIINDRMNIYRIISGANRLPYTTLQKEISTWAKLGLGGFTDGCYSFYLYNTGEIPAKFNNSFYGTNKIRLGGGATINGMIITLPVGGYVWCTEEYGDNANDIISYTQLELPGNSEFSESDNRYTKCNYKLEISVSGPITNDVNSAWEHSGTETLGASTSYYNWTTGHVTIVWNPDAKPTAENWYLNSDSTSSKSDCNACPDGKRFGITQWKLQDAAWYRMFISQSQYCDPSAGC